MLAATGSSYLLRCIYNNDNNNKYLLEVLNCTFFRMKYIIIYVIISSKGLQIKINIFSMLSPELIRSVISLLRQIYDTAVYVDMANLNIASHSP